MVKSVIEVHVKQTGESIRMSCSSRQTVKAIIKYACEHSVSAATMDPDDYYLSLNNMEMLDNDKTLAEINISGMENPFLEVCMKTSIRARIMDLALERLRTPLAQRKSYYNIPNEPVRTNSITKTHTKLPVAGSRVATVIQSLSGQQTTTPTVGRSSNVTLSSQPPHGTDANESTASSQSTTAKTRQPKEPKTTPSSTDAHESTVSSRSTTANAHESKEPKTTASSTQEQVTWRQTRPQSTEDDHEPSITQNLADGYQRVTSKISEVGAAATRDPIVHRDIANTFKEINIVLCGSPRVGKSTLINAIYGKAVAKARPGLDSCTNRISRYYLKGETNLDSETIHYEYNFWDTPGFENWSQHDIRKRLEGILQKPKSDILCMIYCASPGSFANREQLSWMLEECMERQIFCALVCTNKWAGHKAQREAVMKDFQDLLQHHHPKTNEENGVIYYGNKGLCTAVNSERYEDEEAGRVFEQSGVNELIFGIMESLNDEKMAQWCLLAFENKPFWKSVFNFPKRIKDFIKKLRN